MSSARALVARMLAESAVSGAVDSVRARINPRAALPAISTAADFMADVGDTDVAEPGVGSMVRQSIAWASMIGIVGGLVGAAAAMRTPTWSKKDSLHSVVAGAAGIGGLWVAAKIGRRL